MKVLKYAMGDVYYRQWAGIFDAVGVGSSYQNSNQYVDPDTPEPPLPQTHSLKRVLRDTSRPL